MNTPRLDPPTCLPLRPTAAGLCNSTGNVATTQQLRADIIVQSGASDVTIFCVNTPAAAGRRLRAAATAVYTASVCTPNRNYNVPLGERTGDSVGCVPVLPLPVVSAPTALADYMPEGTWPNPTCHFATMAVVQARKLRRIVGRMWQY